MNMVLVTAMVIVIILGLSALHSEYLESLNKGQEYIISNTSKKNIMIALIDIVIVLILSITIILITGLVRLVSHVNWRGRIL